MMYLLVFLITLIISSFVTYRLIGWLTQRQLAITLPRQRDIHDRPVPRLGGLALFVAFWLTVLGVRLLAPEQLEFVSSTTLGIDRNLMGVFLGSLILVIIGVIDDLRGLPPLVKLLGHFAAAAMLPLFGVHIQSLTNPLGGDNFTLSASVDAFIAIVWVVLMINVMNFLDGLDGLATSISAIAALTLFILALAPFVAQPALALLMIALLGACLGFLPFNWHPARIFLGDTGSQFLGYMLAVAAIISGGKLATAALVLGLPILDALWAIVRRLVQGRSPFAADREHLHHRLLALGMSQTRVVTTLMTIATVFGMIALGSRTTGKVAAFGILACLMAILIISLAAFERRRQQEGK